MVEGWLGIVLCIDRVWSIPVGLGIIDDICETFCFFVLDIIGWRSPYYSAWIDAIV